MKRLDEEIVTEIYGLKLKIPDQVYFPSDDTDLLIEFLENYRFRSEINVLEIGSGSAAVSIWIANYLNKNGIKGKITAIDINPLAVITGQINAQLNNLDEKITFLEGDLFSPLNPIDKFDLIIFNPPYLPEDPEIINNSNQKPIDYAWDGGKQGLETLKRFIQEAPLFSKETRDMLFISSSLADQGDLLGLLQEYHYSIQLTKKKHIFFEDIILFYVKTPMFY